MEKYYLTSEVADLEVEGWEVEYITPYY